MSLIRSIIFSMLLSSFLGVSTVSATPSGGDSERQSLLTVDKDSYTVLSVERLGHFTHYRFTNRISLKRYSIESNELIESKVLMETRVDSSVKIPPDPPVATSTRTDLTTLQHEFGERTSDFVGYVRTPKYQIKVSSEGLFMDKKGNRVVLMSAAQLQIRIPDYLQLAEYNAFEVTGIQGPFDSHYFLVVRSNTWGIDVGSFEQVIALPN